jgi:hypothetical protein
VGNVHRAPRRVPADRVALIQAETSEVCPH